MIIQDAIWLVPLFPFLSALLLIVTAGNLPRHRVALLGAGSVGPGSDGHCQWRGGDR